MPHLRSGGVERVNLNLAVGFLEHGWSASIVVADAAGPLRDEVPEGVRLVDLAAGRVATSVLSLVRFLRSEQPSALISSKTHASVAASLALALAGSEAVHVVWEHSKHQFEDPASLIDRLLLSAVKKTYARARHIVTVSEDVRSSLAVRTGVPLESITVLPNPIVTPLLRRRAGEPLEDELPCPLGASTIVAAGRMVREKGFDVLLEAVARVREHRDIRLIILGDGPERVRLEAIVSELRLKDTVALPGFVPNPLPYLRESGAFVLSSRSEGFPVVLIEALYVGCAITATACSDAVERILEDGYGYVVPTDDADGMARGLEMALDTVVDKDALRERAEHFSVERVTRSYAALLSENGCP